MPLDTDGTWVVWTAGEHLTQIRADMDAAYGSPLDYVGTPDGAESSVAAELAWRIDQSVAAALSTIVLATAPAAVVDARARDAGLTPRAATQSRYGVRITGAGTPPIGTILRDDYLDLRWTVVAVGTTAPIVVTVEAEDYGPVELSGIVSFSLVTPVAGITSLDYDPADGDAFQVGLAAETASELRARIRRQPPSGTAAGVHAAVLDVPWVVAVDIQSAAGQIGITVAPAPVGADQEAELAQTIYDYSPLGVSWVGSSGTTVPSVDGTGTVSIAWTNGTTQAVTVVAALTLDGSVSSADAIAAATSAIAGEFAALSVGETIRYLRVIASLDLPGVTGASLTLDGGGADITPATSATTLIPSTTVT